MATVVSTDRRSRLQASPLLHLDPLLVVPPVVISIISLLMIYSSTHTRLEQAHLDPLYYVKRQGIAIVVGLIAMLVMTVIDYRRLRELAIWGYGATCVMLVAVLGAGAKVKGAQARFDIGPFQMQPSEFAKLFVVLVLAGYCALHRGELDGRRTLTALAIAGVPMGLIILQPDLGTDLVLLCGVFAILGIAGMKARHLAVLLLLGVTISAVAIRAGVLEQYQIDRLTSFATPGKDTGGTAYNQNESKITISNGGLWGRGLFQGTQTNGSHVPEQHTDFIFTAVGEELGFAGSALILALFGLVAWRTWQAARLSNDLFGTLCCVGILAMLVFQVFENVGMTMGIMPVTGIPLPWMSYGGSSVIVWFACVGLVANIYMRRFS